MERRFQLAVAVVLCACSGSPPADEDLDSVTARATSAFSELWGQTGEAWSPQSRLPDFSFAGYRTGAVPLPRPAVVTSVKDFGAVGDGVADDTQAFANAIAATQNGALFIPAGRYKITQVLKITKSNIVLRGAGVGATTLFLPRSLTEALGPAPSWAGSNGAWSWSGGFLWFEGIEQGTRLANVTGGALRGDRTLTVDAPGAIPVGSMVRLLEFNNDGTLGRHLHADQFDAGPAAPLKLVDFATRVVAVSGNTVTLERPLRADVRAAWTPQLYSFAPSIQEVGVEDMTLEFPNTTYAGHLVEKGYNGVFMEGVANSWVRNVTILDADSGITMDSPRSGMSRFCTFEGVRLANQWRPRTGLTGHHGIAFEGPQDMLVTKFTFDKQFVHDVTVDSAASGNVFSSGVAVNMNFDHHRYTPYENLFTDIDIGAGDTLWLGSRNSESGLPEGGNPSAARETVWNVRATNAQTPLPNWPQLNIIGMTKYPTQKSGNYWIEQLDPGSLVPQNLHLAQLARRQGGPAPTLTTVRVLPDTATVAPSSSQQFTATGYDQFGIPMSPQPAFTWTVSGGGAINGAGLFTAGPSTGGPFTVTAASGGKSGTASVTVSTTTSFTLAASADTFVRDGASATTNFGTAAVLEVKTHESGWNRETYLRFDLGGVPGAVTQAKLRLNGALSVPDTYTLQVFGVADTSWTDGSLVWNNRPAAGATVLASQVITGTTAAWVEWDVGAYVQAQRSAGMTRVAFVVRSATFDPTVASFSSKESGANRPELVVSSGGGSTNQPPTVASAAAASPAVVTGTTTSLSVLGADDAGEAALIYTWAAAGSPPAPVSFSVNGTHAARTSTATFARAGTYTLTATVADAQGATATSSVNVTVNATVSTVTVTPASTTVPISTTRPFSATASDQFGSPLSPQPSFVWSVSGGGTISSSGLFTAGASPGGPFTVTASTGGQSGTAAVTVTSGGGGTVSRGPIADAFVRDGATANTNFGGATSLEVKTHELGWSRNTFLKFDLGGTVGPVTQARLRLFGSVSVNAPTSIAVFGVGNTSWAESSVTWNNQPVIPASALSSLVLSSTQAQWQEWDITPYVQSELAAGRTVVTLAVRSQTFSATFAAFSSRESTTNPPQLLITSGP